jgi:hypothetical protein
VGQLYHINELVGYIFKIKRKLINIFIKTLELPTDMYTNFGQYQTVLKHFWHNELMEIIQIFRKFQHYYELGKASAALWTVFMHTWGSIARSLHLVVYTEFTQRQKFNLFTVFGLLTRIGFQN